MKKFSFLFIALFFTAGLFAQCTIDTAALSGSAGGFYPAPNHLPHIVKDSAYSQTVQGKIETGFNQSFTVPVIGAVTVTITVDSVRLDSIQGLPAGITWSKNPNVLPGGGYGCVLFSGSTTDSAGRYNLTPIGMVWAHLYAPGLVNKDTFQYGPLDRLPNYRGYYLTVDSAPAPLTVSNTTRTSCLNDSSGSATLNAAGGSPTAPYSYLWSNGATTYTISNVDTGTYYATVTSGVDTLYDTVRIVGDPTPIAITVTADSGAHHGNNGVAVISVSGGVSPYTYRWNNGATTSSLDSLAPGTYRVTVRDSLGCRANDSVVIVNLTLGVNNITQLNPQMSLFPNPAKDLLNVLVESPVALNAKIEAIDVTGKVVYSVPANISNARYTQTIDVSKFSPGIYILQVTSGSHTMHQRFVVTR